MRKKPMSREPLPILRKNPSQAWLLVGTLAYEEAEAARSDHLTQEPELFERERGRLKKRSKGFFYFVALAPCRRLQKLACAPGGPDAAD